MGNILLSFKLLLLVVNRCNLLPLIGNSTEVLDANRTFVDTSITEVSELRDFGVNATTTEFLEHASSTEISVSSNTTSVGERRTHLSHVQKSDFKFKSFPNVTNPLLIDVKLLESNKTVGTKLLMKVPSTCKKPAKCQTLEYFSCLGVQLSYKGTSLSLVENSTNQSAVQRELQFWQGLKSIPRCWAVIQPLLCAVYMPRCEDGMVELPGRELCRITRNACRLVDTIDHWPSFLNCKHDNFQPLCKNEWREAKFNTSTKCPPPLIETDHVLSWVDGVEGCGIPCQNPLFTDDEHNHVRTFITVVGSVSLFCCLFTVITFIIDWRNANRYPALIIFYINVCFLIVDIGWLAQLTPRAREDIVCRKDGSPKLNEPSSGENLSCVIVFVMIYYFVMAAVIWFVLLTYTWFLSFRSLGKIRDNIEAKTAYFHLISWSVPLIFTITVLALGQIEGDSLSGVCFVGMRNSYMRIFFVLLPIIVAMACGTFFLVRGLKILNRLRENSGDFINVQASRKLKENIVRLAVFLSVLIFFVLITITCHVYEFLHYSDWWLSFRNYLVCQAQSRVSIENDEQENCRLEMKPSVYMKQLHLVLIFGTGIVMSSWIWTSSTVDAWKRFCHRLFRKSANEPVKLKKHKIISKAFAKRQDLQQGQVSLSFCSTHDDPLGMNLDLNSGASQDVSSVWTAAIPKFVNRRGGLAGVLGLGFRRNSSTSEDTNIRRGSFELFGSRRHSLDSQISLHAVERERLKYLAQARQQRRQKKKEMRTKSHKSGSIRSKRRGSDVSQHSLPEKRSQKSEHSIPSRPSSALSKPVQSEQPVIAPIRSHRRSLSGSQAADDLLRLATSSGEESSACYVPGHASDCNLKSAVREKELKRSTSAANEHNRTQKLSNAIMDAMWGMQTNDEFCSAVPSSKIINNMGSGKLKLKVGPTVSKGDSVEMNNLRRFPLLANTTLDLDGDSDIRESSSS